MNKAILVIEMPKSCAECKVVDYLSRPQEYHCRYLEDRYMKNYNEKPIDCPLKHLPEWKEELSTEETIIEHRLPENRYASSILLEKAITKAKQRGYNECLKDILGEDNEKCK